jgi:pimeloyl-ACP methyl ester carboxylesterase
VYAVGPVPFRINVEERVLEDLKFRLRHARFPEPTGTDGTGLGTSAETLRDFVKYWRSGYDFRLEEAKLNALPQFKAKLDGAELHFVHVRGRGPNAVPLLLLHGFPDSFLRYLKVIPILTDPASAGAEAADSFDVIVPSLPGFAFTGDIACPSGVRRQRYAAELLWRLMTEVLGYSRFAVAGGDCGGVLAQILALDHPRSVLGLHLTDIGRQVRDFDPNALSKEEREYVEQSRRRFVEQGALSLVESSRPQSLAVALNDSPVALAAWLLDRFLAWSDGDLERAFGKDHVVTNAMLYWVTQTSGSSLYGYHSERIAPSLGAEERVERPVGLALFPNDGGGPPPRALAERWLNVERYRVLPRGGHLAPLEVPGLYAREVMEFFRSHRGVHSDRVQEAGDAVSGV